MYRKYFNQHFMRHYNSEPVLKALDHHSVYLYTTPELTIEWHTIWCSLVIETRNKHIVIPSDYPCKDDKKRDILNYLELIQDVK